MGLTPYLACWTACGLRLSLSCMLLQGQTADAIADLDMQVIETPPKYQLATERLLAETAEPASLEALTADIRQHLGELRLLSAGAPAVCQETRRLL